jgi:hypothetical protein
MMHTMYMWRLEMEPGRAAVDQSSQIRITLMREQDPPDPDPHLSDKSDLDPH